MANRNLGISLGVCGAFAAAAAASAHAGELPYPVHTRTLDNGVQVYVVEMHGSKGVAAVGTWMAVGSGHEVQAGRTGFAHFFEHLMFHGTPTVPGDQRDRTLLRLGVVDNAWTWLDETVYHAVIPTTSLSRWLEIDADRFQNLTLTPDGVQREAGAVYGEFRRWQADPETVLDAALSEAAFRVHPYGHSTLGLEADIAAMPSGHADALAFFAQYYRPENAVVLVVGDVEPEATFGEVARTFGAWRPAAAPPAPPVPVEPPQKELRRTQVDWPGDTNPRIELGWRLPADPARRAPLQLAADLLLADTGPLHRRLVREEGLAYGVYGGRDDTVDPGLFRVLVEAVDADALPKIEAIVREEIAAMGAGVDAARLEVLRTHLRQRFRSSLDDPRTVLTAFGSAVRRAPAAAPGAPDPGLVALDQWRAALAATTAEDVSAAVREALIDPNLTIATLRPGGPAEDAP